MYHVELRHFPHSAWRFNLGDHDLRAVVEPWIREQAVDFGERKWSPHLARLTILEGPKLEVAQLSMGRGWRTAQKQSEDVTEQVLASARQALQAAPPPGTTPAPAPPELASSASPGMPDAPTGRGAGPLSDPVALGVLDDLRSVAALLGPDPIALLEAWRAAAAGSPGLAPSDSLALAERAVRRASADRG